MCTNLLLTVQMCTNKIYCWLYKRAQMMSYLLYRHFLNNQRVLFRLEIFCFFFFVNPGVFFLGVQSNELASNVHKPKKLYWYIFCTSAEHQQRRGPGRVPVPRNQGIYVVNELNIATTVDFSVFTFFLMILYLCVWLIFPSLLQWIESNTFLTKLVFLVFVLILCIIEIHDADSWLHK